MPKARASSATRPATRQVRVHEHPVLVLQGGGALGAYQAGVYEEMSGAGIEPVWVAGISIGAINAAIIAGNEPKDRIEKLREFWTLVSSGLVVDPLARGEAARSVFNSASAALVTSFGIPGFFEPQLPPAFLQPFGTLEALAVYDTSPLRATL